jgi:hypothetical protein
MIEYKHSDKSKDIQVKLNRVRVGTIKPVKGGFQYFPISAKVGGEIFDTVGKVKRSLEIED